MIKFSITLALGLLLCYSALPAYSLNCKIDLPKDLGSNHPLLLQSNSDEFYYPKKTGSNKIAFWQRLRVVCPQKDLQVFTRNLQRTEANLKCVASNIFRLTGTIVGAPLPRITCASRPSALNTLTGETCPGGVVARIGFQLPNSRWANVVDKLCHNADYGQTNWVHHKLASSIRARETDDTARAYANGPFYNNINISSTAFTRQAQRARLLALLNDQNRVDQIMPAAGTNYLVEGQLAPRGDMFYREQQDSTYFYANTVPVWSSIRDGNWRQVENAVRTIAAARGKNLEVYTGGLDVLSYTGQNNMQVPFTLTTRTATPSNTDAVPVPLHLFKYILDRDSNEGLAFITVNNPQASVDTITPICPTQSTCTSRYPEFTNATFGYTYCCSVEATSPFGTRARTQGMMVYNNIKTIDLAAIQSTSPSTDGWVPLLSAIPNFILENIGIQLPTSTENSDSSSLFDF